MLPIKVAFCCFLFFISEDAQIQGKTYYFSLNKTSNEYLIRTRLNATTSIGGYLGELRNVPPKKIESNATETHPFLDHEWDYNWKNLTRPPLPNYIAKYYESSENIRGTVRFLFNEKPKNSTILQYNISEIDSNENISEIELHFFYKVDRDLLQKSLIVRLYQMENNLINSTSLINPDSHKLLNVIYIYQASSGWQIFKLTNSLYNWVKNRTDLSLFITISKPNEEQFSIFKDSNEDVLRTFLVLKEPKNPGFVHAESRNNNSPCKKFNLQIDFAKLNWLQFIIAPAEYNAFTCYGGCYKNDENFPNHFKITSFTPESGRKSLCCVPVSYSPLPIMFYNKKGNVILKIYKDMIVSACGCR